MKLPKRFLGQEDCERYEQDLLLYLHKALPPRANARVAAHLGRCPACRKRMETFEKTSAILAFAVRGAEMPPWNPPAVPKSIWRRELSWYTVIAVVVSLGGTVLLLSQAAKTRADRGTTGTTGTTEPMASRMLRAKRLPHAGDLKTNARCDNEEELVLPGGRPDLPPPTAKNKTGKRAEPEHCTPPTKKEAESLPR